MNLDIFGNPSNKGDSMYSIPVTTPDGEYLDLTPQEWEKRTGKKHDSIRAAWRNELKDIAAGLPPRPTDQIVGFYKLKPRKNRKKKNIAQQIDSIEQHRDLAMKFIFGGSKDMAAEYWRL